MCPSQLSRELQDIMKEQDPSLSADAVGDDVYQWDVLLGGFAPASPLGQVHSSSVQAGREHAAALARRLVRVQLCFLALREVPVCAVLGTGIHTADFVIASLLVARLVQRLTDSDALLLFDYAQSHTLTDAQDLATLGRRHGMSTVHLRLAFARGLHPFYPPSLEVSSSQRQLAHCTHMRVLLVLADVVA